MKRVMLAVIALAALMPDIAWAQNSDLAPVPPSEAGYGTAVAPPSGAAAAPAPADVPPGAPGEAPPGAPAADVGVPPAGAPPADAAAAAAPAPGGCVPGPSVNGPYPTYNQQDVLSAAEGVFGKGAKGLADAIAKIFKKSGEPNAYIAGREVSGAVVVGLRYGSGTMSHKVEGNCPVYWTGPSLGFDLGANASKVFVLVYNLYDTKDLYHRFAQIEGQAYLIGGFTFAYLRHDNVVLVPVRLGVGLRLGANVGYMKMSEKSKWLPF